MTRALGVEMTKDQLGGADIHLRSGVVDNLARDEHDAIEQIKRFLSYLPSMFGRGLRDLLEDPVDRMEQDLLTVVPRDSNAGFEMRSIIEMVVDKGSFRDCGFVWTQPDLWFREISRPARWNFSK